MNADKKLTISVAPMLDVTNTHFRTLCRIISEKVELWTEMVVDDTIIHCYEDESRRKLLGEIYFRQNEIEKPLVLQLGGSDPEKLEKAIEIAVKYNFKHFNLNVGCPSSKVACKGNFGASLFKTPSRVARIVHKSNLKLKDLGIETNLSIKTRIGVDIYDTYEHLYNFISLISGKNVNNENKYKFISIFPEDSSQGIDLIDYDNYNGANYFIIHARKAWLNGINPSKNRTIPQLNYLWVYRLTIDFPEITFVLNGGITSIKQAISLLNGDWFLNEYFEGNNINDNEKENNKRIKIENDENCDYRNAIYNSIKNKSWNSIKGIMIGREVMNNPLILSNVDQLIYGINCENVNTRRIILNKYCDYLRTLKPKYLDQNNCFTVGELNTCLKPILGIFHGYPGTKLWRRIISENIQNVKKKNINKKPFEILNESIYQFEKVHLNILDIPSTEYI